MINDGRYECFECGCLHTESVDKCSSCDGGIIMRRWIPCKETENKGFQMDDYGNMRIVVDGKEGNWSTYQSIASLEIDGQHYIGVSQFYAGCLPHECVLKVEKVSE
jgi:hypothetical protein